MEFHLSRPARERYGFDRDLLAWSGDEGRPDAQAVSELVTRMNERLGPLGRGAKPGHLYALVLIQYILHVVIDSYRRQREPEVFEKAQRYLEERHSEDHVRGTIERFGVHFPPLTVYHGQRPLERYIDEKAGEIPGRHALIERMLLVFLANINPAASLLRDLHDDRELSAREDYLKHVWSLEQFFAEMPTFGPSGQSLFALLTAPANASPNSLLGQLEFIRDNWASLLGPDLMRTLLTAEDLVREAERMPWDPSAFRKGPDLEYLKALASRRLFAGAESEPERYSTDTDWMPRVVLLAKSVYVWLDQLSKQYGRSIRHLDEIPDEELDRLASWGFSGLWLIGLWERSEASRRIKHLRGNTDALGSAYSLWDYRVSGDLGGDAALDNLRERAAARGIRLASDMVPNHMGLDSRWTREHPDWFVQLDHPPFGVYTFDGPDLSADPSIELKVEDGYWTQRDASVVFRRIDRRTGHTRFIYHGNDGTSMPWNDTAQLNFLIPQVREAVTQLILHVARRFPIIRFDAAMTLTKMHYQRLWFPEPGTGGAIPSRAFFGMTKEEFDRAMPAEFWREVVDRVAAEVPDTLLLAEAFWLLEGFFVRTLGMHRVYNSAFMNMLKMEENAKYRSVIKNVLEFDPRMLQRFVNFMNNPDEDTAVAQFGKGDKYFGVCLMMATMPGLPMFGHGQIEGFTEKYGHEYPRAYYDERPDDDLVHRHEREIFPFLRLRHLFSGSEHFTLYDVYREGGEVDENVFAFSNGVGEARALVVFHNRWAETAGWIHTSAAFSVPDGAGKKLVQCTLAEGLGLRADANLFYIFRDRVGGLEYLRRARDLYDQGLFVQLRAYQHQVFTEFREVWDDADARWSRLAQMLGGRGVPSVEREFKRIFLAPLIETFAAFATAEAFRDLIGDDVSFRSPSSGDGIPHEVGKGFRSKTNGMTPRAGDTAHAFADRARPFIEQAIHFGNGDRNIAELVDELEARARAVLALGSCETYLSPKNSKPVRDALVRAIPAQRTLDASFWRVMIAALAAWPAGRVRQGADGHDAAERVDGWLLSDTLAATLRELGCKEDRLHHELDEVRALLRHEDIAEPFSKPRRYLGVIEMLEDGAVKHLIGCHTWSGVEWLHRESLEEFLGKLFAMDAINSIADESLSKAARTRRLAETLRHFRIIEDLAAVAGYDVGKLKTLLSYSV